MPFIGTLLRLAGLLFSIEAAVCAADSALLGLVMPEAKVVAGLQVAQAKASPFGEYVLSHMQPDDPKLQRILAASGFEPRRDCTEILMASDWDPAAPDAGARWLILAKGNFDPDKIKAAVLAENGSAENLQGVEMLTVNPGEKALTESAIAFLDTSTAAMGDPAVVKGAIARSRAKTSAAAALLDRARSASAGHDFWFITLAPLSAFSSMVPDASLSQAMSGNLFQSILQASGGAKFGDNVQFSAEFTTRSEKDAQSLVELVRFLAGMLQQNKGKDSATSQLSAQLDNLNVAAKGTTLSLSLAIPGATLEQIFNDAQKPNKPAR